MALSVPEMVQLSRLLDEAIPLDAAARCRWIERLPAEHRKLTAALRQSFLMADAPGSATIGLETLPRIDAPPEAQSGRVSDLRMGQRVGPYLLVCPLGAGGMAEVWLARRADGAFQREVALKLPAISPLRPDLVHRFALERDILARLEHVNIARMYDAGVGGDGRPYMAMEYVRGEPLIEWCDARQLEVRERVKLFLQLLDAVRYAHAQQVIHRDLKPSNVLVTPDGQVRLLDFGVAKLMSDPTDRQEHLTQRFGRALTPDYASPELVRGRSGNPASDVYSLGIVLYELLSGRRPYRIKARTSVTRLQQELSTISIERPSSQLAQTAGPARATTQRELSRQLCGDLDAIVLKALSPAPLDRYTTVSALAHDLRRYLNGRSVEARPRQAIGCAGRCLMRHWIAAAIALGVLVTSGSALFYAAAARPDAEVAPACVGDRPIARLAPSPQGPLALTWERGAHWLNAIRTAQ
jgi:serine/threonine-protein kinase